MGPEHWVSAEGQYLLPSQGYTRIGNVIVKLNDKGHITEQHTMFNAFSGDNYSPLERQIIKIAAAYGFIDHVEHETPPTWFAVDDPPVEYEAYAEFTYSVLAAIGII